MKLKALLLALFVAGFSASFALADDGHEKGGGDRAKTEHGTTSAHSEGKDTTASVHSEDREHAKKCRPGIEVEVRGTVAAAPTATALAVLVTKGGAEGASLAGKQLTFDLTNARRPSSLKQGDFVQVKGRACVDLVAGTAKLVAERVEAKRAEETKPSSSTTTTTTTASVTTTTTPGTTTTTQR